MSRPILRPRAGYVLPPHLAARKPVPARVPGAVPLLWQGRGWRVTGKALESVDGRFSIAVRDLGVINPPVADRPGWPVRMAFEDADLADFLIAFTEALRLHMPVKFKAHGIRRACDYATRLRGELDRDPGNKRWAFRDVAGAAHYLGQPVAAVEHLVTSGKLKPTVRAVPGRWFAEPDLDAILQPATEMEMTS